MKIYLSLLFLAVILTIWIWDWVVITQGKPQETVSATLWEWSSASPILPLCIGIVLGHVFWPKR
jgi:hypothetical protein